MPDYNHLYHGHEKWMEDFWSRRANESHFEKTIRIFGHPVVFDSNHEEILEAAALAEHMYSTLDSNDEAVWHIHLTVHDPVPSQAPLPERLADLIHYAGAGDWLSIGFREWGSCFVDMKRGEAHAVLSSPFAEKPEQVCLSLLNTILTNFITRHGYSMLHASALLKDGHILLLQAPHGTGKSTTALRLLSNGYRLLSDSMVYIGERDGKLLIGGFPVGRIKLRADMLPLFPALAAQTETELIRNETKYRVDLRQVDPTWACLKMIPIESVKFCLLERWDKAESSLDSLPEEDLWPEIMVNSLHYDTPELWNENLRTIDLMLQKANLHRLRIGTSEAGILEAVNQIW